MINCKCISKIALGNYLEIKAKDRLKSLGGERIQCDMRGLEMRINTKQLRGVSDDEVRHAVAGGLVSGDERKSEVFGRGPSPEL